MRRARARIGYFVERVHHHLRRNAPKDRQGLLERNLVCLNDVLAASPLAGRYWVWGGVLLGWARQGSLLEGDTDADLAVFERDLPLFRASVELLERAGFCLSRAFVNNQGRITEYVFVKDYLKFEFFVVDESDGGIGYWLYYPPDRLEMRGLVPTLTLAPMRLLDRTWLKPDDHEAHLAAMYGDWRTPQAGYWYVRDEKSVVSRHPWTGGLLWAPHGAEIH
ncbi:MAG TPA: hypothetical protein VGN17_22565 [Bryobacteraceae bacterium]